MKQMVGRAELEVTPHPQSVARGLDNTIDNPGIGRLRLLWEQRPFLLRITLWGLLAVTVIAFLIPNRYESTTQLMPPDNQSSSGMVLAATLAGKMSGAVGGLAGDFLGLQSSGDLFIGILKSRTVEDDVISNLDLRRVYGTRELETTRRILAANTMISEDRRSGIITITVVDRDPRRAAAIAQRYVMELNSVVSQLTTSSARREREFLEGRLAQVRQDLETAEKDFSQFASKNAAIDIKEQGRAMLGAAATLQGELIAAESELQGLKQIYADNNVRVRSLRARTAELQHQLEQLGGKDQIATDATSQETGELYPSIRKLPLLGVPYADLYRRTRVQEVVFETLTQEYELAKVAEAKEIPSVKVLDPPNVPERKSFPPRLVIMILGTLFSFLSGVVWVVGRSRWKQIDPQAPNKILAQEVLEDVNAIMPWATPNGSRFQAFSRRFWLQLVRANNWARRYRSSRESDPSEAPQESGAVKESED